MIYIIYMPGLELRICYLYGESVVYAQMKVKRTVTKIKRWLLVVAKRRKPNLKAKDLGVDEPLTREDIYG